MLYLKFEWLIKRGFTPYTLGRINVLSDRDIFEKSLRLDSKNYNAWCQCRQLSYLHLVLQLFCKIKVFGEQTKDGTRYFPTKNNNLTLHWFW